ncbi:MAG: succinylglutamate desuccinylase/aspartoacylase family protein [Myxococcota bacterium]|nr:succinylglutamate desuccinylase/aspartoacylase family protein [Myxococcota bacterium]
MGTPLRIPALVARGRKNGPIFGLTAAIHGNELNGIPVIHRLLRSLDLGRLRGSVVGVPVLNVPSLLIQQRRFNDNRDLNHIFPGKPNGHASQIYVHRILERIIKPLDVLVDLHTASFGRANSLYIRADMTDPTTARMAYLQRPQIIVHNPPADGTLRGAAQDLGIPSITLEIGDPQRFQREYIRQTLAGLRAMLADQGMIPKRPRALGVMPVLCSSSSWQYTDRGGLLEVLPRVTQKLEKGDIIARLTDIYGDEICEYSAVEGGVVIGHAVNPIAQTGARILHLGKIAPPDDPHFQGRYTP